MNLIGSDGLYKWPLLSDSQYTGLGMGAAGRAIITDEAGFRGKDTG